MIFELKIQKRLKSAIEYTRSEDAQKFSMDYYYDYAKTIDYEKNLKIVIM